MPKVGMPDIRKPQLVQATMTVIDRVGLHGASIALISKEAGVSTGIINHYFAESMGCSKRPCEKYCVNFRIP